MVDKADLARAASLGSKEARGRFVLAALQQTADRSQRLLRGLLDRRGVTYTSFYITNAVVVRGGTHSLLREIAGLSGVARISANHEFRAADVVPSSSPPGESRAVEPNLTFVGAPDVWSMGITGQGMVVAVSDTGLDEDHPAIRSHYRGCLNPPSCTSEDHNYNWWDATGTYPTDPFDGHGHGTHVTGIAVGDDGGANQIGMAPGAKTIHCKVLTDAGSTTDAEVMECFQWDLAPWDLNGANPDPSAAPDVVNISWGYWGGGYDLFRDIVLALNAAGILVVAETGNEGPNCATLRSIGDYKEALTVGSVSQAVPHPGQVSSFSARGPSILDPSPPDYFPDVMAPGQNIRSSLPGGSYESWSGVAMATPHAAGLVALMWAGCPDLRGLVEPTTFMIQNTAVPLTGQTGSACGGDYTAGPNNDWGFGTFYAPAAVQAAFNWCDGVIFADGFESGGTSAWSATVP
jgi:subtilisin family serine protease